MRLCYLIDARSPIATGWVQHFANAGHDVHVVSTAPVVSPPQGATTCQVIPLGRTRLDGAANPRRISRQGLIGRVKARHLKAFTVASDWWAAADALWLRKRVRQAVADTQPDLIHAMRIPFEGVLASLARPDVPLVTSVWGNDFTLHAEGNPLLTILTRGVLARTALLHCDCERDAAIARRWGYQGRIAVMPGNGGIDTELFRPGISSEVRARLNIPATSQVVVNARGFRGYVRNDVFFASLPRVLQEAPNTVFVCIGMSDEAQAHVWAQQYGVTHAVRLLPRVSRGEMADLFRAADVAVSPSTHDGTPNTLLESMASGCVPVAGNIESVREWITHGENGLLVDPASAMSLAHGIVAALLDQKLRQRAREYNRRTVESRAERRACLRRAEILYETLIASRVQKRVSTNAPTAKVSLS